jgi:hypothetical protein
MRENARAKEDETMGTKAERIWWGIRCSKGGRVWWYGEPTPALGSEAAARDKAARRNDNDDGTTYHAERYTRPVGPFTSLD